MKRKYDNRLLGRTLGEKVKQGVLSNGQEGTAIFCVQGGRTRGGGIFRQIYANVEQ